MKTSLLPIPANDEGQGVEIPATASADSLQRPELFKPMVATEVSRYIKASTRSLEEWRRRTKETGELVGPPFFQDYEGGKVLYPEICVKRFAMARAAGRSLREATRFAWQPLSDLCSELGWSLPDYLPTAQPDRRRSRHT